jgi:hypothetical protein
MRFLLGMIVGCLLLVVGVYLHDAPRVAVQPDNQTLAGNETIVNWNVARREVDRGWTTLKVRAREGWTRIAAQF